MDILVTGAAGFIGFHVAKRLLIEGHNVVGYDNVNDYYDVQLKYDRLTLLRDYNNFSFYKENLENQEVLNSVFDKHKPQRVIHLAAQAGVRHSLTHPHSYIDSNVVGFLNILEAIRYYEVEHLVYASSSSVYGLNTKYPFSESDNVDHPASLYAATKKSNELMAHSYSHLYNLPTTGLRFFTVYGPWGRPDMALFIFTKAILNDKHIHVFNNGNMERDFTYIDDIVEGVNRIADILPEPDETWDSDKPDPSRSIAPYRIYNIGYNSPVPLMDFIREIEKNLGKKAKLNYRPMQPGDVRKSYADVDSLYESIEYTPSYSIEYGIKWFIEWFQEYYTISKLS
jgi:UDP-glucuronate 4-epimerase